MAIARGGFTNWVTNTDQVATTASLTVTGSNTYGLAFIGDEEGDSVTGVTWNGVAMTQLAKTGRGGPNDLTLYTYIYGIVAPTTGVITGTRTGAVGDIRVAALYATDVSQTSQPNVFSTEKNPSGTATSITSGVITTTNGCGIWSLTLADNGGIAASTNMTSLNISGGAYIMGEAATLPQAVAGTYNMTATFTNTNGYSQIVVALAPTLQTKLLTLLGVGT